MFDFIGDIVDGAIDSVDALLDGDLPSKHSLKQLASAGISVYAMSEMYGLGTSVIENILDD